MFGSSNSFGQPFNNSPFGTQTIYLFGQNNNTSNNPFAPKPFGTSTPFGGQRGVPCLGVLQLVCLVHLKLPPLLVLHCKRLGALLLHLEHVLLLHLAVRLTFWWHFYFWIEVFWFLNDSAKSESFRKYHTTNTTCIWKQHFWFIYSFWCLKHICLWFLKYICVWCHKHACIWCHKHTWIWCYKHPLLLAHRARQPLAHQALLHSAPQIHFHLAHHPIQPLVALVLHLATMPLVVLEVLLVDQVLLLLMHHAVLPLEHQALLPLGQQVPHRLVLAHHQHLDSLPQHLDSLPQLLGPKVHKLRPQLLEVNQLLAVNKGVVGLCLMHLQLRQIQAIAASLQGNYNLYLPCMYTKIKAMRSLGGRTTREEIKVDNFLLVSLLEELDLV